MNPEQRPTSGVCPTNLLIYANLSVDQLKFRGSGVSWSLTFTASSYHQLMFFFNIDFLFERSWNFLSGSLGDTDFSVFSCGAGLTLKNHRVNFCQCCHFLPGHATGITHPAQLLLVVAAAGLADVELAVQTLTLGVDQELEGLQTSNTVRLGQAALVSQQLSLGVFFFYLCLQVPEKDKVGNRRVYYRRQ